MHILPALEHKPPVLTTWCSYLEHLTVLVADELLLVGAGLVHPKGHTVHQDHRHRQPLKPPQAKMCITAHAPNMHVFSACAKHACLERMRQTCISLAHAPNMHVLSACAKHACLEYMRQTCMSWVHAPNMHVFSACAKQRRRKNTARWNDFASSVTCTLTICLSVSFCRLSMRTQNQGNILFKKTWNEESKIKIMHV